MSSVLKLLKIFYFNCKIKLSRGMQYRIDFFIGIFVSLGISSLGPIFQYLIFTQTRGYPNWNIKQIILFQGVLLLWFGIKDILFGEIRANIQNMVRIGEFDMILLKPHPPLGLILTNGFYYQGIGPVIAGFIIITISINTLALKINILQILMVTGFFLAGIILYMAVTTFYCTINIMIVYMGRLGEIIDRLLQFSQYPIEIFFPILRIVFIAFLPIAIWAYFPTQALLGRVELYSLITAACCLMCFIISLVIWEICLKKYTSAGG